MRDAEAEPPSAGDAFAGPTNGGNGGCFHTGCFASGCVILLGEALVTLAVSSEMLRILIAQSAPPDMSAAPSVENWTVWIAPR